MKAGAGEMKAGGCEMKAAFLDRDGVLNKPVVRDGKPYPPATAAEFEIYEDAPEAVRRLRGMGFQVLVVTNQPDVARGTQTRTEIEAMHGRLRAELGVEDFYVCWHDDADACDCRKPKPGLLRRAALDHGITLSESYMIGDRWRDVDCGHAAGCRTIFIDRGYSERLRREPDRRTRNLAEAVDIIGQERHAS
jgi:D-glycero-D-manno-heptose 1,7-bisphosphate phosphatase